MKDREKAEAKNRYIPREPAGKDGPGLMAVDIIILIFIAVTISAAIVFLGARQMVSLSKRLVVILAVPIFAVFAVCALLRIDNLVVSDALVLLVAVMGGCLIGHLLTHEVSIITFGMVVSIVDFFSFSNGLTAALMEAASSDPMILRCLMIHIPYESNVIGLVGISDLYIVGCFYFALKKLGYSEIASVLTPLSGILIALAVGLTVGGIYGIPFITAPVIVFLLYKSRGWRNQTGTGTLSTKEESQLQ